MKRRIRHLEHELFQAYHPTTFDYFTVDVVVNEPNDDGPLILSFPLDHAGNHQIDVSRMGHKVVPLPRDGVRITTAVLEETHSWPIGEAGLTAAQATRAFALDPEC